MTKVSQKVESTRQAGEAVADALPLPVITPRMIDAAEKELMAAVSVEMGPNWPCARITAEAILQKALEAQEAPSLFLREDDKDD
jgi:hypothetical protein